MKSVGIRLQDYRLKKYDPIDKIIDDVVSARTYGAVQIPVTIQIDHIRHLLLRVLL